MLAAQHPAPAAELVRAEILDVGDQGSGLAAHRHLADHLAAAGARGLQRQPDVEAGKIAGEEQIALRLVAVEHVPPGEPAEIAGDDPLRAAGIAAHPYRDQLRHQHLEAQIAVGDALLGYLDGGDIAGVAKDRGGAVPYLANDRDRLLAAEIGLEGGAQSRLRHFLQPPERDAARGEADVPKRLALERAGRPLDSAFDAEPGPAILARQRSEERRVGKECRARWLSYT